MVFDDGGAFWLSSPWLAGAVLILAVSLVLWCHRWLETGRVPAPRSLGVQAIRMSRRERADRRAATARPTIVVHSGRVVTRPLAARTMRRNAA
jgi:hypothetical protein